MITENDINAIVLALMAIDDRLKAIEDIIDNLDGLDNPDRKSNA